MSRVEIATQGWGWVADAQGNGLSGRAVQVRNLDGSAATHWSAVTGGSSSTADLTTNADGTIPRFIESGSYNVTVGGVTHRVEAESGSDVARGTLVAVPTGVAATDTAEIAAKITAAGVGGVLVFQQGSYSINAKLLPLRDQKWIGAGNQSYDQATGGTRLLYSGADFALKTPGRNLRVSGMKIECSGTALGCVEIADPSLHNTFEHVTFKGYDTTTPVGVRFSGQVSCSCFNTFRDCTFHTLKRAQRLSGFANGNLFEQCVTFNCNIGADISALAPDTLAGQDNVFLRCEWDGAPVVQAISLSNVAERNLFIKCVCDGVTASANINAHRNVFIGCVLNPAPTFGGGIAATTTLIDCQQGSGTGRISSLNGELVTTGRITTGDGLTQLAGAMQIIQQATDQDIEFLTKPGGSLTTSGRWKAPGYLEMIEVTAPVAGAADTARLFTRDNGSGKSQLCVQFSSGAVQVIATQP